MSYWLVKSDPKSYSWEDMKKDKRTDWDGVRNYQARNNLKLMKEGDIVIFYHSVDDKTIMGNCIVTKKFFQDTTTDDERWVAVELEFKTDFAKKVTLKEVKANPHLSEIALIKQSRLSVMPVSQEEYDEIIEMSK